MCTKRPTADQVAYFRTLTTYKQVCDFHSKYTPQIPMAVVQSVYIPKYIEDGMKLVDTGEAIVSRIKEDEQKSFFETLQQKVRERLAEKIKEAPTEEEKLEKIIEKEQDVCTKDDIDRSTCEVILEGKMDTQCRITEIQQTKNE